MIKRTLTQLATMIPGSVFHSGNEAAVIEGVSIDTRTIQQGNLYIPIKGERFNGHAFVIKQLKTERSLHCGTKMKKIHRQTLVLF